MNPANLTPESTVTPSEQTTNTAQPQSEPPRATAVPPVTNALRPPQSPEPVRQSLLADHQIANSPNDHFPPQASSPNPQTPNPNPQAAPPFSNFFAGALFQTRSTIHQKLGATALENLHAALLDPDRETLRTIYNKFKLESKQVSFTAFTTYAKRFRFEANMYIHDQEVAEGHPDLRMKLPHILAARVADAAFDPTTSPRALERVVNAYRAAQRISFEGEKLAVKMAEIVAAKPSAADGRFNELRSEAASARETWLKKKEKERQIREEREERTKARARREKRLLREAEENRLASEKREARAAQQQAPRESKPKAEGESASHPDAKQSPPEATPPTPASAPAEATQSTSAPPDTSPKSPPSPNHQIAKSPNPPSQSPNH